MEVGSVVEFNAGSEFRLGVITGEIGKKKLIVWTEHGAEMRPERADISLVVGKQRTDDPAAMTAALTRLRGEVDSFADDIDLSVLWEIVTEMDETMTTAQMADLMLGSDQSAAVLALTAALRADAVYFKARRDSFEPRTAAQVETLLAQREAEERKNRERAEFFQSVVEVLNAPAEERSTLAQEKLQDTFSRTMLTLIKDYAAFGEDFERKRQAEEVLDELETVYGRKLRNRAHHRAFDLLVDLGIWTEHENLWIYRFRIATEPSAELIAEAERLVEETWEPEPWRRDLSDLFCVTIDDAETLDIDDALSCEQLMDGSWQVGIHIADPSARVPVDSALDEDARSRSTSIYLPTGVVPMFPQILTEQTLSLVAGELRPAVTTIVTFNQDFERIGYEVFASTIRVSHRLTYDEVDEMLEGDARGRIPNFLQNLNHIAAECLSQREQNGAMSINLPEVKLRVDAEQKPPKVSCKLVALESSARLLVSEMMILSNQIMAEFCDKNSIPIIYRMQESPDSELLDDETLAVPEGIAREFAILRKMKRGDISTHPAPHFGLGLSKYTQATSPIRRYSDLVCQRQIKAFLAGEPYPYDSENIFSVLGGVDNTAREGIRAERETDRYWLLYYLSTLTEPLDAVVVEIKDAQSGRASVFIKQCAYRTNYSLKRPMALGTELQVVVDRVDPRKDILTLREA